MCKCSDMHLLSGSGTAIDGIYLNALELGNREWSRAKLK